MTTSTVPGLFDRLELELALLMRRMTRLASGQSPPRTVIFPPLTRIRAPAAPRGSPRVDGALRDPSFHRWIGGEPEPLHVIGADPMGS
jgi:hypothetical protein